MIQRIQSVYLLLVAILLGVALCMPLGHFHTAANGLEEAAFRALGVSAVDGSGQSTWGLFCILLLSAIISFITIFLFRNRMLQVRMVIFSSLLIVGSYIVFGLFLYVLSDQYQHGFAVAVPLCLPMVCLILNYLAFRAIYRDEVMVRAADRLR